MSVQGRDSLVWARDYSHVQEHKCDCDLLKETLKMIPGALTHRRRPHHSAPARITSACDGKVIRVDVGMSKGCASTRNPRRLEILRDGEVLTKLKVGADGRTVVGEAVWTN